MARYTEASCRLCRREGMKLFLKGQRCYTEKCAIEKRNYPPGMAGQRRHKYSDYGLQLREKQKVKRMYGLLETQFRNYYLKAERQKGVTGDNLLKLLERRLDNTVLRMGFSSSHKQARLLVRQGHFLVNGHRVNIPSYQLRPGDTVEVKEKSRNLTPILSSLELAKRRPALSWLEVEPAAFKGKVTAHPQREDITLPIQEELIVALYSK